MERRFPNRLLLALCKWRFGNHSCQLIITNSLLPTRIRSKEHINYQKRGTRLWRMSIRGTCAELLLFLTFVKIMNETQAGIRARPSRVAERRRNIHLCHSACVPRCLKGTARKPACVFLQFLQIFEIKEVPRKFRVLMRQRRVLRS